MTEMPDDASKGTTPKSSKEPVGFVVSQKPITETPGQASVPTESVSDAKKVGSDHERRLSDALDKEIGALEEHLGKKVKKEVGNGKGKDTTVLANLESNLWLQEKNYGEMPDGPVKERLGKTIQKTKEAIRVQDMKNFKLALLKREREFRKSELLRSRLAAHPDDEGLQSKMKDTTERFKKNGERVDRIATALGLDEDGKDRLSTDILDRLESEARREIAKSKKKPSVSREARVSRKGGSETGSDTKVQPKPINESRQVVPDTTRLEGIPVKSGEGATEVGLDEWPEDSIGEGYSGNKVLSPRDSEIDRLKKLGRENPDSFRSELDGLREALVSAESRLSKAKEGSRADDLDTAHVDFLTSNVEDLRKQIAQKEANLPFILEPAVLKASIDELKAQKKDARLSRAEAGKKAVGRLRTRVEMLNVMIQKQEEVVKAGEGERDELHKRLQKNRNEWTAAIAHMSEVFGSRYVPESDLRERQGKEEEDITRRLEGIAAEADRLEKLRVLLANEERALKELAGVPDSEQVAEAAPTVEEPEMKTEVSEQPTESVEPGTEPVAVETGGPDIVSKEEVVSVGKDISPVAQQQFESMGIARADLLSIEGFSDLTNGQQSFVAEMLKQTAVRTIEDQARDAVPNKGGLLKSFNLAKSRKAAAGEVLHGGMKTFGKDLAQLVEGMKASGLDMEEKDGKFDIRFLSMPEGFENDATLKAEGESFNEAANRFATIPQEWSLKSASKSERKAYEAAKQAFEASRDRLEKVMFSPDRGETTKEYANLTKEYGAIRVAENRVRLIQQLTAHPEVGEYLDTLEHQNTFLAGLKSVASERFGYFVGGAAGRAALVGTLGLFAAPAVAAVSGGFMGYRRAQESLVEQDRQARRGKDAATKAVPGDGAGWFKNLMTFQSRKSEARLVAGKRRMVRASVSKEEMAGDRRKRGLAERLDDISEQVRIAEPESEQSKRALAALQSRVEYVKERLETDAVNFGDGAEGVRARVALMESLARAEMNLGLFQDTEHRKAIEDVFGVHLKREEGEVQDKRKEYRRKEALNGAVMAGTISLIGAGVMSAVQEASAALQHAPGSGSASRHLNDIYGAKQSGMIEDAPAPGAGPTAQQIAEAKAPATGPAAVRFTNEAAVATRVPGAGAASETLGQTPAGTGAEAGTLKQMATETAANKGAKAAEAIGKTYAETVNRGEGMTHLARRAFAEYAGEKNVNDLLPEQKVYIEDYLQKHVAHAGILHPGDRVEFTPDLMDEAVAKARGLTPEQIRNLHQYVGGARGSGAAAEVVADHAPKSAGPRVSDIAHTPKAPVRELADAATLAPKAPDAASDIASHEAAVRDMTDRGVRPETIRDAMNGKFDNLDDLPPIWGRRADERFFRQYAGMSAGSLFRDSLNAVVDPDSSTMEPARAEYIGHLFLEARKHGYIPRPRESTFEFFLRVGEQHPGRSDVFLRFASGARRYGGSSVMRAIRR